MEEELYDLYVNKGYSQERVAKELGFGRKIIRRWLKKYNIPPHPVTHRQPDWKYPPHSEEFKKRMSKLRMGKKLSPKNKKIAIENLKRSWVKGNKSPYWKDRLERKLSGYIYLRVNGRHVYEHRLIMEEIIGRKLLPGENVHHRNGVRDDNRQENLELWTDKWQPPGQRVEDLVVWAKEILKLYDK